METDGAGGGTPGTPGIEGTISPQGLDTLPRIAFDVIDYSPAWNYETGGGKVSVSRNPMSARTQSHLLLVRS